MHHTGDPRNAIESRKYRKGIRQRRLDSGARKALYN